MGWTSYEITDLEVRGKFKLEEKLERSFVSYVDRSLKSLRKMAMKIQIGKS